jgi:hypothetical protein
MAEYKWNTAAGMADWVLREAYAEDESTKPMEYKPPKGFIMKSSPTTYVAWIPNDAGNRMEFYSVDEAKAWVFAQVRMSDNNALLTER